MLQTLSALRSEHFSHLHFECLMFVASAKRKRDASALAGPAAERNCHHFILHTDHVYDIQ